MAGDNSRFSASAPFSPPAPGGPARRSLVRLPGSPVAPPRRLREDSRGAGRLCAARGLDQPCWQRVRAAWPAPGRPGRPHACRFRPARRSLAAPGPAPSGPAICGRGISRPEASGLPWR